MPATPSSQAMTAAAAAPPFHDWPGQRRELVHSHSGRELVLRSLRPDDLDALKRGFARLSPQDIRRRFLHAMMESALLA